MKVWQAAPSRPASLKMALALMQGLLGWNKEGKRYLEGVKKSSTWG
jgi:hypothetical protein